METRSFNFLDLLRTSTNLVKVTFIVSTGKIKLQGQLTQFVNMELSRRNARSQCSLRVDQISVDHVNPLSGEFRVASYNFFVLHPKQ